MNIYNTPELIRERLRMNPNTSQVTGPLVLWRFQSLNDQSHKDNLDVLRRFLVGNTLTIDGVCWLVQIHVRETFGLVMLHKPTTGGNATGGAATSGTATSGTRKLEDIKAWWKAGLDARGIPLDYTHPFKPVVMPERDEEIDYALD